jgi:uracil-DNA glycosylase
MGVTADEFYDVRRVAIVPMGFCYPGQDAHGGDLPPRRECAPRWRPRLFEQLPRIELMLLVGGYAQRWHLKESARAGVTATVEDWRAILEGTDRPRCLPLPHPSWRNNA